MSTRQGPSALALGTAILLLSTGGALLAGSAAALLYRAQVAARLSVTGEVVAAGAAVVALCGLVVLFAGYWTSKRSTR
jgi:hypothetical protein